MQTSSSTLSDVFSDLQSLSNSAFPKHCDSCNKQYDTLEQLIAETTQQGSGLKEVAGETPQVEVERVCSCNAFLVETFNDRRSSGATGDQRRMLFDRLFGLLTEGGMPERMAKKELLKVMKGQPSNLLDRDQLAKFFA
ncbi:MAG: hypothetical protein V7707_13090 [Motiliproteus sp.]